jgi:hypothetical protein
VTGFALAVSVLGGAVLSLAPCSAAADLQSLACRGRQLAYAPDYSARLDTREPFEFGVAFDLEGQRLLRAPVAQPAEFELREAHDAVFFFRDARIAERRATEWISIGFYSGAYAHFIAPLDPRSGEMGAPLLLTAADCH